jgi:hypothetical protein
MGSGFCIDGSRRIFCSCAHVWRDIQSETPNATAAVAAHAMEEAKAARAAADAAVALATASGIWDGVEAAQKAAKMAETAAQQAAKRAAQMAAMVILDPSDHGVAIGFQPTDKQRAEAGEVDWVGRAVLLDPPGVFDPPKCKRYPKGEWDGLDLVILQLTQQLDGEPLASLVPLVALPLGDADTLVTRDPLTLLGFGVPDSHGRGNMRPKGMNFSTVAKHGDTGRWIETDATNMHTGHSGGPTLGPRGDLVGWNVRTLGARSGMSTDQLRPVDVRFEEALTEALDALDPSTAGVPLRERLEAGNLTLPLHGVHQDTTEAPLVVKM